MTKMRVSTWRHDAVNATTVGEKKNSLHYEFKISLVLLSVTAGVRTIVSSIMLRHNSVPVPDCQCSPLVVHVGHFTSWKERLRNVPFVW